MKTSRFTTDQIIAILQAPAANAEPATSSGATVSRGRRCTTGRSRTATSKSAMRAVEGAGGRQSPAQTTRRGSSAQSPDAEGRLGKRAMTTDERRAVVTGGQGRYDVSERTACRSLGFERTALRYVPRRPAADAPLRARPRELAAGQPHWGLPRLHWRLKRDRLRVDRQRVERVSRLEGLAVRRRRRTRVAVARVPRRSSRSPPTRGASTSSATRSPRAVASDASRSSINSRGIRRARRSPIRCRASP